jgi:hypothetical protein
MGYAGKWRERERARELRSQSWTLQRIADELSVAKGTVSVWVRDVDHVPNPRNRGHPAGPKHPLRVRKEAELERCADQAREWVGALNDRDLSMFALGLYAGEGAKTGGTVAMANTNPAYLLLFVTWLRRVFDIDESRLRVHLYLHEGLDLAAAFEYWSDLLGIPPGQFTKTYRAVADASIRRSKHVYGCPSVRYASTPLKRRVMALIEAVVSDVVNPG